MNSSKTTVASYSSFSTTEYESMSLEKVKQQM